MKCTKQEIVAEVTRLLEADDACNKSAVKLSDRKISASEKELYQKKFKRNQIEFARQLSLIRRMVGHESKPLVFYDYDEYFG